ncbi:hypothetical protein SAMN04487831_103262 [Pseudobutyrivibrio sp. UC1225]|uniref:hypothetical protein n=1 Tax=Pseudobutyrivibrio sp. UC1225 TaxID=1798185 RepID=UPI0008E5EC68|nr:hypothetical protein [Pseudobutyrivibrio sp. UC1225]SFN77996.1 hypothetical protein SAMN04487831_103262 [Pseudobutyrivibrio sp. UC1225]
MLSILLFILIISAFAVFACFRFDKAFEEVLPISCMGIILILFLFGMINILQVGAFVICAAAFFIYAYTFCYIYKNGKADLVKQRLFNLITPGSVVFIVLSGLLSYCNKDRLAMTTDEFSHWLDTVVIMARIDRFGTAPNSTAVFPSYPPAMSLFQYLLEKVNMVCTGDFSEWKCYFAYQLLAVIIMLPFIRVVEKGLAKKFAGTIVWLIALVAPLYFFKDSYASLYIDPFLGVMGGSGFAAVALTKNKDRFYHTYMALLCGTLVLAKDVGLYLAMFIGLFYCIDYLSSTKTDNKIKKLNALIPLEVMLVAKLLWKLELSVSHTEQKFSAPFDVAGTIATIKGQGTPFYTVVYDNFRAAITYRYIYYERLGFNYAAIMALMAIAFILFSKRLYRLGRIGKTTAISGAVIPSVAVIFYILSLFPLYISRFSEYEAENLASFDRYCGIVLLTGLIYGVFLFRDAILDRVNKVVMVLIAVLIVVSVRHSQYDTLYSFAERKSVEASLEYRQNVNILADKINSNTEEDASILFVGGDKDAPFHPILETIAKPRHFVFSDKHFGETIDESGSGLSTEELQSLLASTYDYVAVYSITENLGENYLGIFENPNEVNALSLYRVDGDGKLALVL